MIKKNAKFLILAVFLIIILGLGVYANALKGDFVWDDNVLVKGNTYIKDFSKIGNIFSEDIGSGGFARYNAYRPIQIFTYLIDYSVWGFSALGYHLTNILLHILVALLVFWLVKILFESGQLALITSLLFVVFPGQTEAVTYISGRAEILSAIFLLLGVILYLKSSALSLPVYLLAILSKESSLVFPCLLLLYHYTYKRKIQTRLFATIILITLISVALRAMYLIIFPVVNQVSLLQRMPGFFAAVTSYLRILILPFGLHMEYGNRLFSFLDPKAIFGVIITLGLILYALRSKNKLISFSILWFFLALLPYSGIVRLNAYMAEHWLYLPSVGFFIILASILLGRAKKLNIISGIVLGVIILFYSYLTIKQNNLWRDELTLYSYTYQFTPQSIRINNNLCKACANAGKNTEALIYCKKAIQIDPKFAAAYCNLGNAYKNLGNYLAAFDAYNKAIQISPKYEYAYNMLGKLFVAVGRIDQAKQAFQKALLINPRYDEARENLRKSDN